MGSHGEEHFITTSSTKHFYPSANDLNCALGPAKVNMKDEANFCPACTTESAVIRGAPGGELHFQAQLISATQFEEKQNGPKFTRAEQLAS